MGTRRNDDLLRELSAKADEVIRLLQAILEEVGEDKKKKKKEKDGVKKQHRKLGSRRGRGRL